MKPKEQAEKLYNECWRVTPQPYRVSKLKSTKFKGLLFQDWDKDWTNTLAKKCAMICLENILKAVTTIADKKYDYWIEVKKEIEKI